MARPSSHTTYERRHGEPDSPSTKGGSYCWGAVQTLYVRVTPRPDRDAPRAVKTRPQWVKQGMSCLNCHATWWESA